MDSSTGAQLIGTVLDDRYHIQQLLGNGGMGSVYLATDNMLPGEKIAIKILHPSLCHDDKHIKRFLREVQLTRKISHPNVVRIHDVGQHKSQLFFTMEYIEGVSLREKFLVKHLQIDEIISILHQICLGLMAIHEGGIIHRDLKPGNILIDKNEIAKIADFGVARSPITQMTSVQLNEVVGSAGYMSPELWRGEEVDPTTDIYSLGVMLYEMVTGIRPFDGENVTEVMRKHMELVPPLPVSDVKEVPTWLTALITMMLEKQSLKRPQSAAEILSIIHSATHGSTAAPRSLMVGQSQSPKMAPSNSQSTKKALDDLGLPKHVVKESHFPQFPRREMPEGSDSAPKIKQGLLERSPHTTTSDRIRSQFPAEQIQQFVSGTSEHTLFPRVHNPARALLFGAFALIGVLLLVFGPYRILAEKISAHINIETSSMISVICIYIFYAVGMAFFVSMPVLICAAVVSSFSGQLGAYAKSAGVAFLFCLLLFVVNVFDLNVQTGGNISNITNLHITDIGNAGLSNFIEGALLLPAPTPFEVRLNPPFGRLVRSEFPSTMFRMKYFMSIAIYFTLIVFVIRRQCSSIKESLTSVPFYMIFSVGFLLSVLANLGRTYLIHLTEWYGATKHTMSFGHFELTVEEYSILLSGVTWAVILTLFIIFSILAYIHASRDRAVKIKKSFKGIDPSREIIRGGR